MPVIEVTLVEGRTPEQLRALISSLTEAAVTSLGAAKSSVRVILREIPTTHFAAGDVTIAEKGRQAETAQPPENAERTETAQPAEKAERTEPAKTPGKTERQAGA